MWGGMGIHIDRGAQCQWKEEMKEKSEVLHLQRSLIDFGRWKHYPDMTW